MCSGYLWLHKNHPQTQWPNTSATFILLMKLEPRQWSAGTAGLGWTQHQSGPQEGRRLHVIIQMLSIMGELKHLELAQLGLLRPLSTSSNSLRRVFPAWWLWSSWTSYKLYSQREWYIVFMTYSRKSHSFTSTTFCSASESVTQTSLSSEMEIHSISW